MCIRDRYRQADLMDCGPTCLRMIAKHYGRAVSAEKLRRLAETTRIGTGLSGISDAAEKIGFKTLGVKINLDSLIRDAPLPLSLIHI